MPTAPTDREIRAARPARNHVDASRPYAYLVEPERTAAGAIEDVATIFLTNRECPFRCLMCDLWKNTLEQSVSPGDIPRQIEFALNELPLAQHIKLYNSGNFFDPLAIPRADREAIAKLVAPFKTVIVENHPRFCTEDCLRFRDLTDTELEVAIGLETVHEGVLSRLNKQMTLADFERAVLFLRTHGISVRAFILLRPPYLNEQQGVDWAIRSIEFATSIGVGCCAVIPTRAGNGIMEVLQARGEYSPPDIRSMEAVLDAGLKWNRGRVFVDLWDVERFSHCAKCGPARIQRLQRMNLSQEIVPHIHCACESPT